MFYLLAIASFFIGYYLREVLDYLKAIYTRLGKFQQSSNPNTTEVKDNFVEPMTRAEMMQMLEKERIDMLNK